MGSHEKLVQESNNQKNLGMLYAWLGTGLRFKEELRDSYRYLLKALELGESFNELKIIGHACCCLTGTCTELGLLEDAIGFGKRAQEISTNIAPNHDIFRSSLFEMGLAYAFKGDCKQVVEVGNELINYGRNQSDPRSIANGYLILGWGDIIAGDIEPAVENCQKAIQIAKEPTFVYDARIILGYAFVMNEQFEKAEENLCELVQLVENFGFLIRNVPFATKKAAYHFSKAIKIANEIGAKSMLGQAHFNLGLLFKTKKETERAKEHISEAIKIFEICQADVYLKNANKAMASL
jgi:tetratricopeptide (TPR) repeat protein